MEADAPQRLLAPDRADAVRHARQAAVRFRSGCRAIDVNLPVRNERFHEGVDLALRGRWLRQFTEYRGTATRLADEDGDRGDCGDTTKPAVDRREWDPAVVKDAHEVAAANF